MTLLGNTNLVIIFLNIFKIFLAEVKISQKIMRKLWYYEEKW